MIILPANTLSTGYDVDNSCRFDEASTAYQHITYGSAGNQKTWTFSTWFKRASTGAQHDFWSVGSSNNTFGIVYIGSNDAFVFYEADSGSTTAFLQSNRLFRDLSSWYHVLFSVDTTQSTANNRQRLWVNGTEVTSMAYRTNPSQNADLKINSATKHYLGGTSTGLSGLEYNGYMAEVVFLDGTAVTGATDFGEFDEDSPTIWKPKDVSGLSFGSNGFYLDFEDSSNLGNNAGSGAADLTEVNLAATDSCTDSPTNNFATLNPLMGGRGSTLSEGNLKVTGESDNNYDVATFGSDMKWYYEWKVDENYDGAGGGVRLGAIHIDELSTNDNFGSFANTKVKLYTNSNDGKTQEGGGDNVITSLTRATTNDIIMCACDGTNAKIWWGINGTWLDYGSGTGDPANGTNPAPWSSNAMASGIYFPITIYSGTAAGGQLNLGNPSFTISSGNADANGYGNFEYAVPSGFYALCTKNLAEYG